MHHAYLPSQVKLSAVSPRTSWYHYKKQQKMNNAVYSSIQKEKLKMLNQLYNFFWSCDYSTSLKNKQKKLALDLHGLILACLPSTVKCLLCPSI